MIKSKFYATPNNAVMIMPPDCADSGAHYILGEKYGQERVVTFNATGKYVAEAIMVPEGLPELVLVDKEQLETVWRSLATIGKNHQLTSTDYRLIMTAKRVLGRVMRGIPLSDTGKE